MPGVTFSGIASGIDGDALIKATIESRRIAKVPFENRIQEHANETTSLEELNTKLLSFKSLVEKFSSVGGGGLEKSAKSSSPEQVMITAGKNAIASTSQIKVLQLASSATLSFSGRYPSLEAKVAPNIVGSGKLTIGVGEGAGKKDIVIDITAETTLDQLMTKLNDAGEGYLGASLLNTGTTANPSYALYFKSTNTGIDKGSVSVQLDEALSSGAPELVEYTIDQASNARLEVAGVGEISRASNTVDDVVPGAVIELKQVTTQAVSLSVGNDVEKTADEFQKVIDLYNELVVYSGEKSKVERTETEGKVKNVYGDLGKTNVDEDIVVAIRNALSGSNAKVKDSAVNVFSDLGVTIQRDGTYKFEREKFIAGASKNPESVDKLISNFSNKVGGVNGIIANYTRFQGIIAKGIDANKRETESMEAKLERMERSIQAQAATMRMLFAELEANVGKMQQGSASLMSMLGSTTSK